MHAYFEKSVLVIIQTPQLLVQKCYERIIESKLALPFEVYLGSRDLLNECIPLLKSPEVKLIIAFPNSQSFKVCRIRSRGVEKGEKNKVPTLIFCSYFDNRQKFVKEGDVAKKKWDH